MAPADDPSGLGVDLNLQKQADDIGHGGRAVVCQKKGQYTMATSPARHNTNLTNWES